MVLAVCGGSPGEKDDLDPGNGATASSTANAAKGGGSGNGASAAPVPDTQSGSAQQNTAAAADAAIQVFNYHLDKQHHISARVQTADFLRIAPTKKMTVRSEIIICLHR